MTFQDAIAEATAAGLLDAPVTSIERQDDGTFILFLYNNRRVTFPVQVSEQATAPEPVANRRKRPSSP